jgi:hypothetical protein
MVKRLQAGRWSLDFLLWQNHFLTTDGQDLHGWAEMRRAVLGRAKLALCFKIPSQASLHGILKPHRSFCCANSPAGQPPVALPRTCPGAWLCISW